MADGTSAPDDGKEPLTVRDLLTLEEYLDAGGDLTALPDLESVARVIVVSRHAVAREERERLAGFFFRNLRTWLAGGGGGRAVRREGRAQRQPRPPRGVDVPRAG